MRGGTAQAPEGVERARLATNTHYERPPAYFRAFLDPRLKYSSGLYATPETSLAQAQTDKLRMVVDLLGLTGGSRLLDVGCGWGSLTLFAAREYGAHVTAVTPAGSQAAHVRAEAERLGVGDRITLVVDAFSRTALTERYDAVSLLGSIVHMPDREDVLAEAYARLVRGGRLYLSESCFRNEATYRRFNDRPGTRHVTEGTFGYADMVPLSRLVAACETAGFSLSSLTDLTADYERTIADWIGNAQRNAAELDEHEGGCEDLLRYLETANAGWGYTTKHYAVSATRRR